MKNKPTLNPIKTWEEWAKLKFGQVPLRDFGDPLEKMTIDEFIDSVKGQTFVRVVFE